MSQSTVEYENLKKEIIKKSGNSIGLQKIKDCFSCIVNSNRTLSRIKTLNELFVILEERDVLNSEHVSILEYLGNIIRNDDIINLVHAYEKIYIEDDNHTCSCGKDITYILPVVNPQRENSEDNSERLETAMNNIAMNIGKNWRVLASELQVPECYVDQVREKYPSDVAQQALKVLQVWKKYNGNEATLDVLKRALEARLCKMKGIGIHMLKPVITIE